MIFCLTENSRICQYCGDLPTPLVDDQTSWVYSSNPVQFLYISCYVTANKLVLSYLLLRFLPQYSLLSFSRRQLFFNAGNSLKMYITVPFLAANLRSANGLYGNSISIRSAKELYGNSISIFMEVPILHTFL